MVTKKYWDKITEEFGSLMKKIEKRESVRISGMIFSVLPNVFSPVYSSDTEWFAEQVIPYVRNKQFLEIGTGAGAIACLAKANGATRVVATDINPSAVENAKLNAKSHSLQISIRSGSLFKPIKAGELFDVIFWNHPFNFSDKKVNKNDPITASLFDENYRFLRVFFRDAKKHLSHNGKLILGTSNVARIRLIKEIAKKEGYKSALASKKEVPIFKGKKIKMDLRIYVFELS